MSNQQGIQLAIQLYQNGKIKQAKKKLKSYIANSPNDINANLLSAAISASENDFASVVSGCRKVLEVDPVNLNAIYNAAVASGKLKNYQDVVDYSSRFLQLEPQNIPSIVLQASALSAQGKQAECISFIESLPELLVSKTPEISMKLAECYMSVSNYERALQLFRANISANVNTAECYHNIGIIMDRQGNIENAIQAYHSAVSIAPDVFSSNYNLAFVLDKRGYKKEALKVINRCFEIDDSNKTRQAFVQILSTAGVDDVDPATEKQLLSVMADKATDAQLLSAIVIELLQRRCSVISALLHRADEDDYEAFEPVFKQGLITLNSNSMLKLFFANLPITNYRFERFAQMLRRALLLNHTVVQASSKDTDFLCAAVAIRCYINGYISMVSDTEQLQLSILVADFNEQAEAVDISRASVIAMYVSLYELYKRKPFTLRSDKSAIFSDLIKLQLDDNIVEEKLYASIKIELAIEDETSLIVQNQYEANPYPVWQRLSVRAQESVSEIIQKVTSYTDSTASMINPPDILIAGTGTGSHAIQTAMRIEHTSMTAIDLSRRSLSFAKRKAAEYGFESIDFKQLDILKVSSLGRKFGLIESVGVLHHMHKPLAGLCCLVDILEPDGLMNIGLYSKLGRRYIIEAKARYDKPDCHITDDEIRQLRIDMMNADDEEMVSNLVGYKDFYSLHDCRDLIFHENENNYDINELACLIRDAGLEFIGFDLHESAVLSRFRKMFPGRDAQSNIENWGVFEEKYPDTFSSMYVFWCRKKSKL